MADRAHSTSRRALLAGLSATTLFTVPAAGAAHPDAALLSLEPELAGLAQAESKAIELSWALEAQAHALADARAAASAVDWQAALKIAEREVGFTSAEAALVLAMRAVTDACSVLMDISASTLDGLCMKARFAEHCDDLAESIVDDLIAIDQARRA